MGHFTSYYKSKLSYVPFVPTDIAGCQLWLKADAGITKDGSNYVSQWDDQSGNNNHAVQATGSAQPLWEDNQFNGKPVISFDGLSKYLSIVGLNLSQPIDIVIVMRKSITDSNNRYIMDGVTNNTMALYANGNDLKMYSGAPGPSKAIIDNQIYLVQSVFSAANSSMSLNDGVKTVACSGTIGATGGIIIGKPTGYPDSFSFNGAIAEIVIYDNVILDPDRLLLQSYLNTKYALW